MIMYDNAEINEFNEIRCPICRHFYPIKEVTGHHLIPKAKGGARKKKAPTCTPCHKQIHAIFDNKELARDYNTIEKLLKARVNEWQKWIKWSRKRKPDDRVKTRQARRRR